MSYIVGWQRKRCQSMLPLIDHSALSHTSSREAPWTWLLRGSNGSNGTTLSKGKSNSRRNHLTDPGSHSTQHATHLLPWLLAHLTDLPTHSLNADALFRTGEKWRHGAMTTSCQRTVDLQSMRRDFKSRPFLCNNILTEEFSVHERSFCLSHSKFVGLEIK